MEGNNQEYISVVFALKAPNDSRKSTINTIVLLLRDIVDMEEWQEWEDLYTLILNDRIEQIKRELDNLKIVK